MEAINLDKLIYQLTVEDIQTVAKDVLKRELTESEIKLIEEKISDHIDWFDAIHNVIIFNNIK